MPALCAGGDAERPIKQVAHMGQYLSGLAACTVKSCKMLRSAFEGARSTVG